MDYFDNNIEIKIESLKIELDNREDCFITQIDKFERKLRKKRKVRIRENLKHLHNDSFKLVTINNILIKKENVGVNLDGYNKMINKHDHKDYDESFLILITTLGNLFSKSFKK
jgi:hypothetical protein